MKKNIIGFCFIIFSASVLAQAQDPPVHYCSFHGTTPGQLEVKSNGSEYLLGADGAGLGIPASVTFKWVGSTVMVINAVGNINRSGGGTPLVNIDTGVSFNNPINNAAAIGAQHFQSGSKSVAILGSSTEQQDTMHVKMVARSSSSFPIGTYEASTTVTCY